MRKRLVSRGLVVAVLAGAMSLAAASSHASPARGSASACSSLRNVVAFDGQASVTGGASASGSEDPAGTLTIELVRSAQKVHVHLADKRHEGNYYKFNGHASGGHVVVADVYGDTGGDYQGELNYNQPLGHLPAGSSAGAAVLGIDFSHCAYKFDITFGSRPHTPATTRPTSGTLSPSGQPLTPLSCRRISTCTGPLFSRRSRIASSDWLGMRAALKHTASGCRS